MKKITLILFLIVGVISISVISASSSYISPDTRTGFIMIPASDFPAGGGKAIPIYVPEIVGGSNQIRADEGWTKVKEIVKIDPQKYGWKVLINFMSSIGSADGNNELFQTANIPQQALFNGVMGLAGSFLKSFATLKYTIIVQQKGSNYRAIIQQYHNPSGINDLAGEGEKTIMDPLGSIYLSSEKIAQIFSLDPITPGYRYTVAITIDSQHKNDNYLYYLSYVDNKIRFTPKVYAGDSFKIRKIHWNLIGNEVLDARGETYASLTGAVFDDSSTNSIKNVINPLTFTEISTDLVCTPKICFQLGKTCGAWDNGCQQSIDCGSCSSGQSCSNGQCISSSCTPKTCSQLVKTCGGWDNGCQQSINCGTCTSNKICLNGQCVLDPTTIPTNANNVILTLYMHENIWPGGVILPGARIIGYDGANNYFDVTTNSNGYANIPGVPGAWSFTASKTGYQSASWPKNVQSSVNNYGWLVKTNSVCNSQCSGKICGDNGCGGSCGSCSGSQTCNNGQCTNSNPTPTCTNQCSSGQTRCNGQSSETCVNNNGCWIWGNDVNCPNGCQGNGFCIANTPSCTNQCSLGISRCNKNNSEYCYDYNHDGCTEWNLERVCDNGCNNNNGFCYLCTPNSKYCDGNSAMTCNPDGSSLSGQMCSLGQSCNNGNCVSTNPTPAPTPIQTCTNQCTWNTNRCNGQNSEYCSDKNGDGCSEWSVTNVCSSGCRGNGICNSCVPKSRYCDGNSAMVCNDYGSGASGFICGAGLTCSEGACISSSILTCATNWYCGLWSTCANNQQTRTCTDINNCGTNLEKPSVSRTCTGTSSGNNHNSECTFITGVNPIGGSWRIEDYIYTLKGWIAVDYNNDGKKEIFGIAGGSLGNNNPCPQDGAYVHTLATSALGDFMLKSYYADNINEQFLMVCNGDSYAMFSAIRDIPSNPDLSCASSCTPNCNGKTCGDDGCGGTCGSCSSEQTCTNGNCVNLNPICIPSWIVGSWSTCSGGTQTRTVSDLNNCGITVNKPATSQFCAKPICTPQSLKKTCGTSVCGNKVNNCGTIVACGNCKTGQTCTSGKCVKNCVPKTCSQLKKTCGSWGNGCGGIVTCGNCKTSQTCTNGKCVR